MDGKGVGRIRTFLVGAGAFGDGALGDGDGALGDADGALGDADGDLGDCAAAAVLCLNFSRCMATLS